jgi:flagellar secretion chaperone FliS
MANASDAYLRDAVLTATPEQLHLMLYDGAIRFTRQALEGLEQRNWEAAFEGFSRAQKIIAEMLSSLNYNVDRALCNRMAGLYNFIYRKLVEAGVSRNPGPAKEALRILEYQRETWVMLIEKLRQGQAPAVPAATRPAESSSAEYSDAAYGALSVQG